MWFRNYDHLKYGPFSLDTEPVKFWAFWNCFYSAIFNRKHLKFGLAIHFHPIISKTMYLAKKIYKTNLWWSAKIAKIIALMFFLPFSESYKLTRKNPNMLDFIVVILYQEFFRLKPVSNISKPIRLIRSHQSRFRPKNDILEQISQAKKSMLAFSKRLAILHILSYL